MFSRRNKFTPSSLWLLSRQNFSGREITLLRPHSKANFLHIDTSFVGSNVPDAVLNPTDLTQVCLNILAAHKVLVALNPREYRHDLPKLYKNMDGVEYQFEDQMSKFRDTYNVMSDNFDEHKEGLGDPTMLSHVDPELCARTLVAMDSSIFLSRMLARPEWLPEHRRLLPNLAAFTSAVVGRVCPIMPSLPSQLIVQILAMCNKYGVSWDAPQEAAMEQLINTPMNPKMARSCLSLLSQGSPDLKQFAILYTKAMGDCSNFDFKEIIFMLDMLRKFPEQGREPWLSEVLRRAKIMFYSREGSVVSWGSDDYIPVVEHWKVYPPKDDPATSAPTIGYMRRFERDGDYKHQMIYNKEALRLVTVLASLNVKHEDVLVCDLIARMNWTKNVKQESVKAIADMISASLLLGVRSRVPPHQFEEMIISLDYALAPQLQQCNTNDLCRVVLEFSRVPYRPQNLHRIYAALAKGISVVDTTGICMVVEAMVRMDSPDEVLLTTYCNKLIENQTVPTLDQMRMLSACVPRLQNIALSMFVFDRWMTTQPTLVEDLVCVLRVRAALPCEVRPWDKAMMQVVNLILNEISSVEAPDDVVASLAVLCKSVISLVTILEVVLTHPDLKLSLSFETSKLILSLAPQFSAAGCRRTFDLVHSSFDEKLPEKKLLEVLPLLSAVVKKMTPPEGLLQFVTRQCIDLAWSLDQAPPPEQGRSAFEVTALRRKRKEEVSQFVFSHLFKMGCKERAEVEWNSRI